MLEEVFKELRAGIEKAIEALRRDLSKVRTGRAHPRQESHGHPVRAATQPERGRRLDDQVPDALLAVVGAVAAAIGHRPPGRRRLQNEMLPGDVGVRSRSTSGPRPITNGRVPGRTSLRCARTSSSSVPAAAGRTPAAQTWRSPLPWLRLGRQVGMVAQPSTLGAPVTVAARNLHAPVAGRRGQYRSSASARVGRPAHRSHPCGRRGGRCCGSGPVTTRFGTGDDGRSR